MAFLENASHLIKKLSLHFPELKKQISGMPVSNFQGGKHYIQPVFAPLWLF